MTNPNMSLSATPHQPATTFHGSPPGVGARLTNKTRRTRCGKKFQAGDVMTVQFAQNMAGTFHHTDCEDPQLENLEDA